MKIEDYVLIPKDLIKQLDASIIYQPQWGNVYFKFKQDLAIIQKESKSAMSLSEKSFDAGRLFQRSIMEANLFEKGIADKEEFLNSDFV
jgi:hypothetical protein